MVGDFVVTERHLRRELPTPRSVGMGSYNMDSHNTQRYVAYDEQGRAHARNEGDIQISPGGPYPIDYGALIPKRGECDNLLVSVCVSTSHIAFGSVRMEPVFMILGQSAATAAALALEEGIPVQELDYARLAERLLADKQVLDWDMDEKTHFNPEHLEGLVLDNPAAERTGPWSISRSIPPMAGLNYLHDSQTGEHCVVRYRLEVPEAGAYEVRISYPAHGNRATNTPVTVHHAGGADTFHVNQRLTPSIDGAFHSLGVFHFEQEAIVLISNEDADGHVVADAVQLLPVPQE
jgi:hypothetical protein